MGRRILALCFLQVNSCWNLMSGSDSLSILMVCSHLLVALSWDAINTSKHQHADPAQIWKSVTGCSVAFRRRRMGNLGRFLSVSVSPLFFLPLFTGKSMAYGWAFCAKKFLLSMTVDGWMGLSMELFSFLLFAPDRKSVV